MMALRNRSRSRKLAVLAVALAIALGMAAGNIGSGTAGPPAQQPGVVQGDGRIVLNYQGRLLDPATGNPKPNGLYTMGFSIYDVESLGSPLWTESRSVSVTGGLFSTLLGDILATPPLLPIFDGRALWLGVTVLGDPEAAPRMRLAYAPYALHAENAAEAGNAGLLGGQPPSAFAVAGHTHTGATIVDGSVALADLAAGSVDGSKIVDGSVALADLAANSVDSSKIVDGSIGTGDLADNSVTVAKVSHSGAVTGRAISYDGTNVVWDLPAGTVMRYTVLSVNCYNLNPFTTTYARIANLGSFTKLDAGSDVEIVFNGRISVYSFDPGSTGAEFELRVDDVASTNGRARADVKPGEAGSDGVTVSMMGIFSSFGAGAHNVSMWVRGWYGGGTYGGVNPNCYTADHLVVKEVK